MDGYRIAQGRSGDDNGDTGQEGERELKGRAYGLYSPFGRFGHIKSERGYTHTELMNEVFAILILEQMDAPIYTTKSQDETAAPLVGGAAELKQLLGR